MPMKFDTKEGRDTFAMRLAKYAAMMTHTGQPIPVTAQLIDDLTIAASAVKICEIAPKLSLVRGDRN